MLECMDSKERLAQEIKRLLGNRSQQWLAEHAGVAQSTISRLLRGLHEPEPKTLERIANVLGVDPRAFLELAGLPVSRPARDPQVEYLAQRLEDLPPGVRGYAIDLVRDAIDTFWRLAAETGAAPERPGGEPRAPAPPLAAEASEAEQVARLVQLLDSADQDRVLLEETLRALKQAAPSEFQTLFERAAAREAQRKARAEARARDVQAPYGGEPTGQ